MHDAYDYEFRTEYQNSTSVIIDWTEMLYKDVVHRYIKRKVGWQKSSPTYLCGIHYDRRLSLAQRRVIFNYRLTREQVLAKIKSEQTIAAARCQE